MATQQLLVGLWKINVTETPAEVTVMFWEGFPFVLLYTQVHREWQPNDSAPQHYRLQTCEVFRYGRYAWKNDNAWNSTRRVWSWLTQNEGCDLDHQVTIRTPSLVLHHTQLPFPSSTMSQSVGLSRVPQMFCGLQLMMAWGAGVTSLKPALSH